ncbi:MAG: glycoside hydrolase family 30 protein [Proteobacteria bacterium]|nr:glycoside hydrolase family 30 protein [Pseudomonadota bacterium]
MQTRREFLQLGAAGALGLALPRAFAKGAATRTWTVVETSRDGARLAPRAMTNAAASGAATLSCDPSKRFQQITGFGGALTESSAYVLKQLPEAQRLEVLKRYYDPREGIGYTLARTHIGSCDFALSTWSLAPSPGDYELLDFSLKPMQRWLMPLLRDSHRIAGAERFKLVASPWSPPAWMKTNNQMDRGGSLREEYAATWANYYVKFIKAMRDEEKIAVWGLTVQNEPEANQTWESCLYTPEQERDFVRKHLGPTLAREGFGGIKLYGFDHNRDTLEKRADAMLGDPETAKYMAGMAVHWYVSDDYGAEARVLKKYPGKEVLFTEGCVEGGARPGDWMVGERYARNLFGDLNAGVCGWIDWNIALDLRGGPNHVGNFCDAPVLVDTHGGKVLYQPSFYAIAHFSRYVKPGAHRVEAAGGPQGLQSCAFANPDGSVAVVAFNPGDAAIDFNLDIAGERHGCRIPAHAIQTYLA